jgi:hypothetical protein
MAKSNPYIPANEAEQREAVRLISLIREYLRTPAETPMPERLVNFADSIPISCEMEVPRRSGKEWMCQVSSSAIGEMEIAREDFNLQLMAALEAVNSVSEEDGEKLIVDGHCRIMKKVPESDESYNKRIRRKKLEKVCYFVKTLDCEANRKDSEEKSIEFMMGIAKKYGYKVEKIEE